MKKIFVVIVLATISSAGFAQTKKIAHRSHSGSNSTFSISGPDNFGTTPEMIKKQQEEKAKADSLAKKAVIDSIARIIRHDSIQKPKTKTKGKNKDKDSTSH